MITGKRKFEGDNNEIKKKEKMKKMVSKAQDSFNAFLFDFMSQCLFTNEYIEYTYCILPKKLGLMYNYYSCYNYSITLQQCINILLSLKYVFIRITALVSL